MRRRNFKGSFSVFAAISFMLIVQFLFTMIEAARYVEMKKVTKMQSESQVESLFAEYCKPLWEEYHFLAVDADTDYIKVKLAESADKFSSLSTGNIFSNRTSFIRSVLDTMDIVNLELVTDESGQIFEAEISSYMRNNIAYETARRIYDQNNALNDLTDSSQYDDSSIDNALDVINNPQDYQNDTDQTSITQTSIDQASTDQASTDQASIDQASIDQTSINRASRNLAGTNPQGRTMYTTQGSDSTTQDGTTLSEVRDIQSTGILALVLGSNTTVSGKSIDNSNVVSKRQLSQGINVERPGNGWLDKVMMQQYIQSYMSSYTNPIDNRALKYECEYLICGKKDDKANLKGTINRILAIREAANFAYILSNPAKMQEVTALATAIGGATLNPAAILAIESGLIATWAYCESILDLRALLQGDKVPIMKSDTTWTSGLSGITTLLSGNAKAISSETGISYQNYLGFLIISSSTEKIAYRTMDMFEKTINAIEGYEDVKMDNMFCKIGINIDYKYDTVFAGMVSMISENTGLLRIRQHAKYAYF